MRHFAPTHRRFRGTSASRPILLVSAPATVPPSKDRRFSDRRVARSPDSSRPDRGVCPGAFPLQHQAEERRAGRDAASGKSGMQRTAPRVYKTPKPPFDSSKISSKQRFIKSKTAEKAVFLRFLRRKNGFFAFSAVCARPQPPHCLFGLFGLSGLLPSTRSGACIRVSAYKKPVAVFATGFGACICLTRGS